MGSADGGAPGRVAEFDGRMHFVANHFGTISLFQEWPAAAAARRFQPPWHFGPSGLEPDDDLGFHPAHQHAGRVAGPVLRGSVRIWDYRARKITKTIQLELAGRRTPRWEPWT